MKITANLLFNEGNPCARMKSIPFLSIVTLAFALGGASAARATMYSVTDLGVAAGWSSRATGVNNSGTVVGNINHDTYDDGSFTITAFRYAAGTMTSLRYDTTDALIDPTQVFHHQSRAYAINNAGQIAGGIETSGWTTGGYTELVGYGLLATVTNPDGSINWYPGAGPHSSMAWAISSSGQIAGTFSEHPEPTVTGESAGYVGSSGWQSLEPTSRYGAALGMNDVGQTVGYIGNGQKAFVSTGGVTALIDNTLGGNASQSFAFDINNNGVVVGRADVSGTYPHAFSWTADGGMVDLGILPGGWLSSAKAINDTGMIVGAGTSSSGGPSRAFLYTQDFGMIDLNNFLLNDAHMLLVEASAISENGYIAGYGVSTLDGQEHAFLLTPDSMTSSVPEGASTAGLMLLALAGLVSARKGTKRMGESV